MLCPGRDRRGGITAEVDCCAGQRVGPLDRLQDFPIHTFFVIPGGCGKGYFAQMEPFDPNACRAGPEGAPSQEWEAQASFAKGCGSPSALQQQSPTWGLAYDGCQLIGSTTTLCPICLFW